MKKSILFGLLTAAMFTACSNDDVAEGGGKLLSNGEGYISLAINLPTTPATRAANDNFDDGLAQEYAVKDATLVLFQGTDEASAKITTAYDLNLSFNLEGSTTDNITSTAKIVQKINDPLATGSNFYALVVLNKNGMLTVGSDNKLTVNGTDVTGKTLKEFITDTKIATSATQLYDNANVTNFFMSNAPLYTAAGGATEPNGEVKTLAEIDPAKVYETESDASSNPATIVNVERAVAKVTVSAENGTTTINSLNYEIEGWQLNNTNTDSYLVRNVEGFDAWKSLKTNSTSVVAPYRFVGAAPVVTGFFRTYWGVDPNYNAADGTGMTHWDETAAGTVWLASKANAYCAENTFDVEHQKEQNTTEVIIKVKFNNGATFYTINNNSKTFYDQANLDKAVKAQFLSNTSIISVLKPLIASGQKVEEGDLTVTYTTANNVAGKTEVAEIVVAGAKLASGADLNASTLTVAGTTSAVALINNVNTIRRYVDGMSYYPVLIKHFGDDLTPWKNGETPAPSASDIYPATNKDGNYLGRYGVLRNNWYDINVTSIKNLGEATVPSVDNFDDNIEQYISVKINILAWAKRVQNVVL
jgi:hypothetical protein